jgi:rfaE bifunctional protein kinase chain/domain
MTPFLTDAALEDILTRLPSLRIGVVGDLFLDRYLDLDANLTEPSVETGLDAYQVVRVRSYPGAAGTVINNLVALGVGRVSVLSVIGDDGEGYELRRALAARRVEAGDLVVAEGRFTPTYTKPMLTDGRGSARELNRLDIKNRERLPPALEGAVLDRLPRWLNGQDAVVVSDQVTEAECGVVTTAVRERLAALGEARPDKPVIADSRGRIGLFRNVLLKPNQAECRRAVGAAADAPLEPCVRRLAEKAGRPVLCTRCEEGVLIVDPRAGVWAVPAYPVPGPIDPVGAGDSVNAAVACALAAGATLPQAGAFGNLVASITIRQLGTTGTATPDQVRRRWAESVSSA